MEFHANEGKNVEIEVNGTTYLRHAIKTRFVKQGEDYVELFREYVLPIYEEGNLPRTKKCRVRAVRKTLNLHKSFRA